MRRNFAVTDVNIISLIKTRILNDECLLTEFLQIMPESDLTFGRELFDLFVERLCTLHGKELASQLMQDFAQKKRRSTQKKKATQAPQMSAKYEQLRAARKRKRLERISHKHEVFDLTVDRTAIISSVRNDISRDVTHVLGEKVSALEGKGSATRLLYGTVVEIDTENELYVICCDGVSNFDNGYLMVVPFKDACTRINKPVHTELRKRRRKQRYSP